MKKFKLEMTRPEFMKKILIECDPLHVIHEDDLKRVIGTRGNLQYCCYTVMMDCNISPDDIEMVNDDSESVAVKLSSKQLAKKIKETWNHDHIHIGSTWYIVHVKLDGAYVIVSMEPDPDYID